MAAYWGVLAAAALTTLVAAAVAAAIAVFMGQALPLAVQHDLSTAPGTAMSVTALVNGPSQAASGGATLRSRDRRGDARRAVQLPVGLLVRSARAGPRGAARVARRASGKGNTTLLQAASMSGIASHATLIAGRWPTAPTAAATRQAAGRAAIPAALPASAAALLHVSVGRRAAAARPARQRADQLRHHRPVRAAGGDRPGRLVLGPQLHPRQRRVGQLPVQHLRPAGGEPGGVRVGAHRRRAGRGSRSPT